MQIDLASRLRFAIEWTKMLTGLHRGTTTFHFDYFWWNRTVLGGFHKRPQSACDLELRNISSPSTSSKSRPLYPVPASSWFCRLNNRDIQTPASGLGDANHGVWLAGVITLPTSRYQHDGEHTAPSHSYGQGQKKRLNPLDNTSFRNRWVITLIFIGTIYAISLCKSNHMYWSTNSGTIKHLKQWKLLLNDV